MKKLISIFLLLITLSQCIETFSNSSPKQNYKIQDHFVFISTHLKLNKKSEAECKDKCILITDITKGVSKINKTFINTPILVGSGFVYKNNNNKTQVLTADHICSGFLSYVKHQSLFSTAKEQILKAITKNENFSFLDAAQINNNYNLNTVITLFDFNGNKYESVKVLKQSKSKDLCLIESNKVFGKPVLFSDDNCNYSEEIINVSANDGIYFPNAVPYNSGIYSGDLINKKRFGLYGDNEEISLYTLDITNGSSGSAVFSKKTKKLCGNISATMKKSGLSIGSTNNSIKEFVIKTL